MKSDYHPLSLAVLYTLIISLLPQITSTSAMLSPTCGQGCGGLFRLAAVGGSIFSIHQVTLLFPGLVLTLLVLFFYVERGVPPQMKARAVDG